MRYSDRTLAGLLFFLGSAQFLTAMMLAEALYPNYSVSGNYISDLGVGSTALLFNTSVFLLGALSLLAAYLFYRAEGTKIFVLFVFLSGLGAIIVGLFNEKTGTPHVVGALLAFLFGGLAAIIAYPLQDPPLRYLSVVLGIIGIVALVLFEAGDFLGLGVGGMERMIAYPSLLWEVAFGGYLMAVSHPAGATETHVPAEPK